MIHKLIEYLKGTRTELRSVNWPTKKQTMNSTMLVVGISLFVAMVLGFFDSVFSYLLKTFVF